MPGSTGKPLEGLRVVECASFVAGPSGCMTLGQLGADIIRVDPIGGGPDYQRWPVSERTGKSLYWTALNKGKRSVAVDLRSPEGRELVIALATASGRDNGIVVDNNAGRPWLSYEVLAERRTDVIQVHIQGYADGRPAVDYTVNPEVGVPHLTGPAGSGDPVNHVLPAWDLLAGMTAVTGLLAALHRRERSGQGAFLQLALHDVALAGVAGMGWLAEAEEQGDRSRHGNHLYGSFGVDFATGDGRRVMVVALTPRQWAALRTVTGTEKVFAALEDVLGVDLDEESERFRLRETIAAVLRPWFEARVLDEVTRELDAAHVLWSGYRTMGEVAAEIRAGGGSGVIGQVDQPGIGEVLTARSPLRRGEEYGPVATAPRLGEHTGEVLGEVLGLDGAELGGLVDRGVVAPF
ncbi:CoA transferase [Streptomyces brevispora]|uniref:2-methylfumaryl-CoA isomerase n=2 Tax=Streptomyces brevispora TaxID=887462 RepID=A0A561UUF5_9ACTN|nr:CoA transferase [Streptomyces brevispora]TWG02966.1 2-methylfumaryl-CoA isomerase [Streptomyces brevispora]